MKTYFQQILLILITVGLYIFYFQFNETVDFESCKLCDAKEYKKLYDYFETRAISQIAYPFHSRPLVPFMASLIPSLNVSTAFHIVNLIFIILSVLTTNKLWDMFSISPLLKGIGFGWLLTHWTGLIRYNLFDHLTVDVPLYFIQSLSLIVFYQKKYKWFYLIVPFALLQKESFLAIGLFLLLIHIWNEKKNWFKEGRHLLYALLIGIFIQQMVLSLMPEQADQRNSFLAIIYHGKLAIDNPSRFIRLFAAFGSAYGIIPFIAAFKAKFILKKGSKIIPIVLFSLMYCSFGLLAGEDMTRILFLGFPFIMTLSLLLFQNESKRILFIALCLSIISIRIYPFPIDNKWGVDYAPLEYVYSWAAYYFLALAVFALSYFLIKEKNRDLL